jgi:hypothetical protein
MALLDFFLRYGAHLPPCGPFWFDLCLTKIDDKKGALHQDREEAATNRET